MGRGTRVVKQTARPLLKNRGTIEFIGTAGTRTTLNMDSRETDDKGRRRSAPRLEKTRQKLIRSLAGLPGKVP